MVRPGHCLLVYIQKNELDSNNVIGSSCPERHNSSKNGPVRWLLGGGEGETTPLDNMRATQQEREKRAKGTIVRAGTGLAVVGTSGPVCTHPFPL